MKVMVNGKIYDAHEIPIAILLDKEDKERISRMPEDDSIYAIYPEGTPREEIMTIRDQLSGKVPPTPVGPDMPSFLDDRV